MHAKFIQLTLFSASSLLLVHSAIAQIIPAPTTPSPIPNPIPGLIGPTPNPTIPPTPGPTAMPELPPTPPPIPTIPPVTPPPIVTPTVPPVPTIPPAPTVPPLSSPPAISPPPVLERAAPQAATAVIRYGPGHSLTLTPFNDWGRFQKVALQPGQVVTVVFQLSPPDFAKPADIQVLDGGGMAGAPLPPEVSNILGSDFDIGKIATVSVTGQLLFSFRPGNDIGLHRVSVIVGGNQYFFQFWRQNPSALNNNPSMLRAY